MSQLSQPAQRLLARIQRVRARGNVPKINPERDGEALAELRGAYTSDGNDSRLVLGYFKPAVRARRLVNLFYVTDVREEEPMSIGG